MKLINTNTIVTMLSSVAILALSGCDSSGLASGSQLVGTLPVAPATTVPATIAPAEQGGIFAAPPEDEFCPDIPAAVKQPATLDQDKTKLAVNTALISSQIAYLISDGGYFYGPASEKSVQEPKEVSKLASALSVKIKTLQENTVSVKKTISFIEDGSIVYGETTDCDSGTYFATFNEEYQEGEEGDTYMEELTLTFNECVLEENTEENSDLIQFFNYSIMATSVLHVPYIEVSSKVYTYNGSLSLTFNDTYAYTNWSVPAPVPVPTDHGGGYTDSYEGNTHLITEALSVEYRVNDVLREVYKSTEDLEITFDGYYESNTTYQYVSDEAWFDGNYTRTYIHTSADNMSIAFEGSETQQSFGDINTSTTFTALCYTAEIENVYESTNISTYVDSSSTGPTYTNHYENMLQSSGYLTMQNQYGEEVNFFDVYSDGLKVASTYVNGNPNDSSTLSIDGTVGSLPMGGSVVLDTQNTWLMSSEYPQSRSNQQAPMDIYVGNYYFGYNFQYTPYAGKTVLTGTNTATVEFMLNEDDYTYGTITIEGEDPVEYDNIWDMFGLDD